MNASRKTLRIGFIPLVDAAALFIAADMGLAEQEGLELELVREVSWSNVRDKLNIGLFDAAHMLAPVAIASSLGLGHVRVPLIAPFCLGLNGNAITVSPALFDEMAAFADGGDMTSPHDSASALRRVIEARKQAGKATPNFGMTFPFSTHNYLLRHWMAGGGINPDEDVHLVVLPPPYMVDSLANGHVEGYCVGAPWNSAAVDRGVGNILHFGSDIISPAAEKVLAMRQDWADANGETLARLIRALTKAAALVSDPQRHAELAEMLAKPNRVNAPQSQIFSALSGRMKLSPNGTQRIDPHYFIGGGTMANGMSANRPNPDLAEWLYRQMVRWHQADDSAALLAAARGVFRADMFDRAQS